MTQDHTANSLGVSLSDVIALANESPASEVVLVLDCCYSGDVANLHGLQAASVAGPFQVPTAVLREGVTILAASRATEPSAEMAGHGAFTRLLTEGLEGAAADVLGTVTALSRMHLPPGPSARGSSGRCSSRTSSSPARSVVARPSWTGIASGA